MVAEPPPEFGTGWAKRTLLVTAMTVQPLLGTRQQRAIDRSAELTGGAARPIAGEQSGRQQRIAQHHAAVRMDQQDPRGECLAVRQCAVFAHALSQRLKAFHELQIAVGGSLERPALAQQTPPARILSG